MYVDKARGYYLTGGIDDSLCLATAAIADRHDASVADRQVACASGSIRAVNNFPAANQ